MTNRYMTEDYMPHMTDDLPKPLLSTAFVKWLKLYCVERSDTSLDNIYVQASELSVQEDGTLLFVNQNESVILCVHPSVYLLVYQVDENKVPLNVINV